MEASRQHYGLYFLTYDLPETWVQSLSWTDPPGEGNGNPLQYSCLENPMGRGTRWAIVLISYEFPFLQDVFRDTASPCKIPPQHSLHLLQRF